jgi:hypothetical protein
MAVRLSIGAGRFRVIRQLLTESVLLASIGGAVGVLVAIWGIRFLTFLLANGSEEFTLHPNLNWKVLGAAAALLLLTGLLFGLAPALQSTRVNVIPALKEARAGQTGSRHGFWRVNLSQALVASQIGISLLMLVAAGLFVQTLSNLQSIELGFNREEVLLFRMNARQAGHHDPEIVTFYRDLQKRFSTIPGVRGATASDSPLIGEGTSAGPVLPVGAQPKSGENPHILTTGPNFFTTMQIPVLLGRGIEECDRPGSPAVAVVSEAYVKTYFGDRNPLGQHLSIRGRPPLVLQCYKNMLTCFCCECRINESARHTTETARCISRQAGAGSGTFGQGYSVWFVRRIREWIPAQVACQVSDRGRVRGSGRFESHRIFS